MEFFVVGADGAEYGPVSLDGLKSWVTESRIIGSTVLRNSKTNEIIVASSLPGLFPNSAGPGMPPLVNQSQYAQYPRMNPAAPQRGFGLSSNPHAGKDIFWRSVIYVILGPVFFFVAHGIGIVFSAFGLVYAFRSKNYGNPNAKYLIPFAVLGLILVAAGWGVRLLHGSF